MYAQFGLFRLLGHTKTDNPSTNEYLFFRASSSDLFTAPISLFKTLAGITFITTQTISSGHWRFRKQLKEVLLW